MLSDTEGAMIKKWAAPRAIVSVCWLVILLLLNGIGSWVSANVLFRPTQAAIVTLEATPGNSDPVTETSLAQWQQSTVELLGDTRFHAQIAKRLSDRRLDDYQSPEAVTARLKASMSIDQTEPDRVTVSLAGSDPDETLAVLDVVASTLAAESKFQARRRGDHLRTSAVDERKEGGVVRYAALNPVPIADHRAMRALQIFLVLSVLSLFVVTAFYLRLIRAKRLFEEDEAALAEA